MFAASLNGSRERDSPGIALRSAPKGDFEGRLPGSRGSLEIRIFSRKEMTTDIIVTSSYCKERLAHRTPASNLLALGARRAEIRIPSGRRPLCLMQTSTTDPRAPGMRDPRSRSETGIIVPGLSSIAIVLQRICSQIYAGIAYSLITRI